jgi:hypothetical protein
MIYSPRVVAVAIALLQPFMAHALWRGAHVDHDFSSKVKDTVVEAKFGKGDNCQTLRFNSFYNESESEQDPMTLTTQFYNPTQRDAETNAIVATVFETCTVLFPGVFDIDDGPCASAYNFFSANATALGFESVINLVGTYFGGVSSETMVSGAIVGGSGKYKCATGNYVGEFFNDRLLETLTFCINPDC